MSLPDRNGFCRWQPPPLDYFEDAVKRMRDAMAHGAAIVLLDYDHKLPKSEAASAHLDEIEAAVKKLREAMQ